MELRRAAARRNPGQAVRAALAFRHCAAPLAPLHAGYEP
jgi:hypothetical protein